MERNTSTTIDKLTIGDRFYVATDKKKEVFEKVVHGERVTKYQTYKHFAKKDQDNFPRAFKSDTQIIFLRSKELNHAKV